MPDMEYQAGISAQDRQALGRWTSTSMADTYSREQRNTVLRIWRQVTGDLDFLSTYVPIDPQEPTHTEDDQPATKSTDSRGSTGSWEMVPPTGPKRHKQQNNPTTLVAETHHLPRGPYRIVANSNNARVHALDVADKTVCGWRPRQLQLTDVVDVDQWKQIAGRATLCKHCWRHLHLPEDWPPPTTVDTDTSASADSSSQDSD